ncbi:lipoprotein [Streptomyces sp. NPDC014983]|uniref:lipoprotein n=1 Tax=Streptomyces sp. NPDC014983 TaxID=3364933 RepID=UPI0036FD1339
MRIRVEKAGRRAVVAVTLAAVLGGCAGRDAAGTPPTRTEGPGTKAPAVMDGRTLGAAGSPCALPVRFDLAKGWQARPIDATQGAVGSDGDLGAALLRQGPVTAACEIDSKPAGHIGFLRVWTGRAGGADPRGVLRGFVAAEGDVGAERYRAFTTGGGVHGVEVEYSFTSELLGTTKKESAFAVGTPGGPVVVHLGGIDTEEHDAMLPAYELAKRTLRVIRQDPGAHKAPLGMS